MDLLEFRHVSPRPILINYQVLEALSMLTAGLQIQQNSAQNNLGLGLYEEDLTKL